MTREDLEPFVEAYVLANTPDYLLARLQPDPRVEAIRQRMTVEQLFAALTEADQSDGGLYDLVKGYVALVALLREAEITPALAERLKAWPTRQLQWLPAMFILWDSFRRPATIEAKTFMAQIGRESLRSESSASYSAIIQVPP